MRDKYVKIGNQAQNHWYNMMTILYPDKPKPIKSTDKQDMFEHWDFEFDGRKKDIKNNFFNDYLDRLVVFLELKNTNGDNGWLFGKADDIVFQIAGENKYTSEEDNLKDITFIEIPRIVLVKYHIDNTKIYTVLNSKYAVHKLYTSQYDRGHENHDLLTAVLIDDLYKFGKTLQL